MPNDLQRLLDESPVPYRIEIGTRHYKLIVGNRMATILPKSKKARAGTYRAHKNVMANVRRAIREQS
jgi:hypothetical protein